VATHAGCNQARLWWSDLWLDLPASAIGSSTFESTIIALRSWSCDGNAQPAIAAAEKATVLSPENDNAWVGLASIQLRAGRKPAAIDALRRAIELNPANKRQLSRNKNFEALLADPEFKKLIGQ
jgi:tetratricopeptide (TPR) repeat protein